MDANTGINAAYQELNKKAERLYEFVILYYGYIYANHSYGTEQQLNMMEIHTLTYIDDTPGVSITELAHIWHKTKSAVSQTVKKLADHGYVEKRQKENNNKSICLYVTEKGKQISSVHKAYDVADIAQTSSYLEERCGKADVEAFHRVLDVYTELLKEGE